MKINVESKFNIGDLVYFKQEVANSDNLLGRYAEKIKPGKLLILTVWIENCYGGQQIHYDTRAYIDGKVGIMRYSEIELTNSLEE